MDDLDSLEGLLSRSSADSIHSVAESIHSVAESIHSVADSIHSVEHSIHSVEHSIHYVDLIVVDSVQSLDYAAIICNIFYVVVDIFGSV